MCANMQGARVLAEIAEPSASRPQVQTPLARVTCLPERGQDDCGY